jgi:hypothetical protein
MLNTETMFRKITKEESSFVIRNPANTKEPERIAEKSGCVLTPLRISNLLDSYAAITEPKTMREVNQRPPR